MTDESAPGFQHPYRFEIETPREWERIVHVEVPRDQFDHEYARLLTRAVKGYARPGFRKGKAPRKLVERELGDRLRAETFEALVPRVFRAAVVEHRLIPITDPELRDLHFEDEGPITFDLRLEVRPQITAHDYDDLPLQRREVSVSTEDVDQVVDRLRESRSVWEPVDRGAAEGDQLTLDLRPVTSEGEDDAGKAAENQKMTLGAEHNLPAFNEELAGAAAGDEREVEVVYPDDFPNEELRGRRIRFRCLVKQVSRRVLPEVNDAFAAEMAGGQTLLELRGEIRRQLEQEAAERADRELEEQIVDQLIERHEVEVPPSLLEQYLASSVEELHARNLQMGREISAAEDERFRDLTRPVAERVLKGMFIMEAIRRQEKIRATDAEIEERIVAIAAENGFDLDKYREYVNRGDERERIRHGLEERKTFDFLISRARVATVREDEGDRTAEPASGAGTPAEADARE
ncbi:MAG: trigger factor [Candidatus Krumholzibacteriia bacterium]